MEYSALGRKEGYGNHVYLRSRGDDVSALVEFCAFPQVKLEAIREAANKLSMMVLPMCYFDSEMLCNIMREIADNYCYTSPIKDVVSRVKEYTEQDLYVLCPVSLYNLVQAEQDGKQREVIFGGELMHVKALLDTITQIQRNLFALLSGDEADTGIWEIGEGSGCSENELMHLRILVATIMPIQHSLLKLTRGSNSIDAWEETMRTNHCTEVAKVLKEVSQQLSWSKEAEGALRRIYSSEDSKKASWIIPEATAITNVLFFTVPHGTSLLYDDEIARVVKCYSVNMPKSFYLERGFVKQSQKDVGKVVEEIRLSFHKN